MAPKKNTPVASANKKVAASSASAAATKSNASKSPAAEYLKPAKKYYALDDEPRKKKTRKAVRPTKYRKSLEPGAILILLAGKYRGRRVVLLKHLTDGVLLVTGPHKINGVPLRRVNARFVIATQTKIDLDGVDKTVLEKASNKEYFAAAIKERKIGGKQFFEQGQKPEPKKPDPARVQDQKSIDGALLKTIAKQAFLKDFLASSFSLSKGDYPHQMIF